MNPSDGLRHVSQTQSPDSGQSCRRCRTTPPPPPPSSPAPQQARHHLLPSPAPQDLFCLGPTRPGLPLLRQPGLLYPASPALNLHLPVASTSVSTMATEGSNGPRPGPARHPVAVPCKSLYRHGAAPCHCLDVGRRGRLRNSYFVCCRPPSLISRVAVY